MFVDTLSAFDLKPTDFWMIIAGMVIFVVYWKISESVLFGPLLKLFEKREGATLGAQKGATKTLEEASKLEAIYEESINEARRDAVTERLKLMAEANKEASRIVSEAEKAAKEKTAQGRAELSKMETALRAELNRDVDSLAGGLADKILGGV